MTHMTVHVQGAAAPASPVPPGWPRELYLIGCGASPDCGTPPSAQSMGVKAHNLLRMAELGLRVPPAFVLGTHYCGTAPSSGTCVSPDVWRPGLHALERACGLRLGDARRPLLLSVRSGAPVSMPGMMETLLNIGLCDATAGGLLRQTGHPRLVWDAYRRLVATHGEVVAGLPGDVFERELRALAGSRDERDLDFAELRELTRRFLAAYRREAGRPFPQDPLEQLTGAIAAVFASWQAGKAVDYRRQHRIGSDIGTAVAVQAMVFGNTGGASGAGVGFTRDPSTGEHELWVDFLFNAQGEDVVSGRRSAHGHAALAEVLPNTWAELRAATAQLERAFGDMQDFEFTVQDATLYLLQTRSGKRTPQAAARIALDLLDEGVIDRKEALRRTAGLGAAELAVQRIVADGGQALSPLAHAASAATGVAIGQIAFDGEQAAARRAAGADVILLRRDAETSDSAALQSALGLLTQRGARTSHAAVVARQLGKVCLVGCEALSIDEAARTARVGDTVLREGDVITLDGNTGALYAGAARTVTEVPQDLLDRLQALRG